MVTRSPVPPGARLSRRISSCRRGSEAKCSSLASSSAGWARQDSMACEAVRGPGRNRAPAHRRRRGGQRRRDRGSRRAPRAPWRCRRLRHGPTAARRTSSISPKASAWPRPKAPAQQRAAALGNGRKQVGEESVGHGPSNRRCRIRIQRPINKADRGHTRMRHRPSLTVASGYWITPSPTRPVASDSDSFPANSVGVLPVTWRKAWENAGTLA